MALINCSECGAQVSDKATTCPHCGAPVSSTIASSAHKANMKVEPVHCEFARLFVVTYYILSAVLAIAGIIVLFAANVPAGIFVLFIALIFFLVPFAGFKRIKLSLENGMVTGRTGLINSKILTSPVSKIQSVSISNGLWGKVFHYHTIKIATAGTGRVEYVFDHMTNAQKFVDTYTLLSNH